ncbi:MAG: site-2 protease family protein [Anaerolineae bacterium]|nr:site-2 protease family protein [Anaerolineae bacterium]
MRGSWRMARLAGVNINVHWSFSFIILWVIVQGAVSHRNLEAIIFALVAVLLLFACVTLHELGHALIALRLNVPVKNIILLPIGGLAQMQSLPEKPVHEMLIAGAGPLVNLSLVIGLIPAAFFFSEEALLWGFLDSPGTVLEAVMQSFFEQGAVLGLIIFLLLSNVILFIFNLIPAFPMDGGRILRAFLALFVAYPLATQIAVMVGRTIALLLILGSFYFRNPALLFVAIFVFIAGRPIRVKPSYPNLRL